MAEEDPFNNNNNNNKKKKQPYKITKEKMPKAKNTILNHSGVLILRILHVVIFLIEGTNIRLLNFYFIKQIHWNGGKFNKKNASDNHIKE